MKLSLLLLSCLVSLPAFAQATAKDTTAARQQITAVVDDFRDAILQKDKKKFLGLFLREDITWQSVDGDELMKRRRQKNPQATRINLTARETPTRFIDGIVADKGRSEEKFINVRIDTDGTIASVSFEFTFLFDDRVINRGQESWHLVNTDSGWKIASVIWSNN
ncbi:nuclear transport factor 2 family protein [Myxococcus faecalis]|uniref:nuclear transport factor 2 family protein n=1 Tax=Myxococcus TaxID=32 RepID=UPI001CC00BD4|nr:nuclear transport factor 2 family protein [Myxococcus sp. AS-1-15]MBZ4413726.1 nuclear transport factor 2 family protein [Myxococcus sp. XM-1-1-1]BDT33189.1 nuclear transport factor 2 family protein [Myxococcus sp. MH1]